MPRHFAKLNLFGLFLGCIILQPRTGHSEIIAHDNFADGNRLNQNLPDSLNWILANNGSAVTESIIDGRWTISAAAGSSLFALSYFTEKENYINLAVGDKLEFSCSVTFSSPATLPSGLRVGLFKTGASRLNNNINSTGAAVLNDWTGYGFFATTRSGNTSTGLNIYRRSGGNPNLFTSAAGGFDTVGASSTAPGWSDNGGTQKVAITVERETSDRTIVTVDVGNYNSQWIISSGAITSFDAIGIFTTGYNGSVAIGDAQVTHHIWKDPPPSPERADWAAFRNRFFGQAITPSANPYADPDSDGYVNLCEHALGNNPLSGASTGSLQCSLRHRDNQLEWLITYPKKADDLEYRIAISDSPDANSWSETGVGPENVDAESGLASRMIILDDKNKKKFARLQLSFKEEKKYPRDSGYRGIWFALGQESEYGDKYSGGLGTYTSSHAPMALYSAEVRKTFFTYGGSNPLNGNLRIMISSYDHATETVPRPVILREKIGVNDPHDNASLSIDDEGYIWACISGRSNLRPGFIYKSKSPYEIDDWELISQNDFAYPQPWWIKGKGLLFLYTRYTNGRELYSRSSPDGRTWGEERKIAGFGGHYQVSAEKNGKIITAFNRHPEGNVDARTDLYFMQSLNGGENWQTVGGQPLELPLSDKSNPAKIFDYAAQNLLVYLMDISFDNHQNPIILYLTSSDFKAGPAGGSRRWLTAHWNGEAWSIQENAASTHNYDTGSISVDAQGIWSIFGPSEPGPQYWGTGGEVAMWSSQNQGLSWNKTKILTSNSLFNHSFVRHPYRSESKFHAYWADGDPGKFSESRLYFTNSAGSKVWRLPYVMEGDIEEPAALSAP